MTSITAGLGKGTLKFGRTVRLLYSPSSSPNDPQQPSSTNDRRISSSSKSMNFLTESTSIIQDGTKIEELPILIRRATRDTFPFTSHSYCGNNDKIRRSEDNVFDMTFKDMLENCDSVSDVFNLLEVPPDKVQGHSAVYALQRLHILMSLNTDWKQIHSFIRRAVIGELYHIVERDIRLLSNFSLVTLVDCYFSDEGFSATCSEGLIDEISHRIVEGLFSVEELLSLVQSLRTGIFNSKNKLSEPDGDQNVKVIQENKPASVEDMLSDNASIYLAMGRAESADERFNNESSNKAAQEKDHQKYKELLQNVWVHLASRCNDMDENTIPWTMQLLPYSKKMFIPHLDKRLADVWQLLSAETAAMCLDNLVRLRTHNSSMMAKLGRYAFLNIHLMTPSVLLSFLRTFLHFSTIDDNLILVIEKCISKTTTDTPSDLLVLCVEYLRSCKYVSPIIMDVAADHFTQHWESYTPLEIFALLRCYGQLNYLPSKSKGFLSKVDKCLNKRFNVMDENHLLEVLASFSFVNVFFNNLGKRVQSQYFLDKIEAMKNPSRTHALMWKKILIQAVVMESNAHRDTQRHLMFNSGKPWSVSIYRDSEVFAIHKLKVALDELLGHEYNSVLPFYICRALYLDKNGIPIRISREENGFPEPVEKSARSLAILLRSSSHFTRNTQQLIGSQRQRMDHLKKLGFTTVEIRATDFFFQSPRTCVTTSRLADFIDFDNPEVSSLPLKCFQNLEKKYLKDWTEDGEMDGSREIREEEISSISFENLIGNVDGLSAPPSTEEYRDDED